MPPIGCSRRRCGRRGSLGEGPRTVFRSAAVRNRRIPELPPAWPRKSILHKERIGRFGWRGRQRRFLCRACRASRDRASESPANFTSQLAGDFSRHNFVSCRILRCCRRVTRQLSRADALALIHANNAPDRRQAREPIALPTIGTQAPLCPNTLARSRPFCSKPLPPHTIRRTSPAPPHENSRAGFAG
jgi:hypothetical protein